MVVTPAIHAEYVTKATTPSVLDLLRRKNVTQDEYLDLVRDICSSADTVRVTGRPPPCGDEDDRKYLHCAVAARVDYLVSYDNDLLDLGMVRHIPIVKPGEFLARLRVVGAILVP